MAVSEHTGLLGDRSARRPPSSSRRAWQLPAILLAAATVVAALVTLTGVFSQSQQTQTLQARGSSFNMVPQVLKPAAHASDDQTLFTQTLLEDPRLAPVEMLWDEDVPWDEEEPWEDEEL